LPEGNSFAGTGVSKDKETAVTTIPDGSLALAALGLVLAATHAYAQNDRPVRIGGKVAQANLISSVAPVYPAEARRKGVEGTVTLQVLIGQDGYVARVTPVSGPPELVQSAVDAVRQWVYKPTTLNGEPVSMLTTVDVRFMLPR
jgi:protein TonB